MIRDLVTRLAIWWLGREWPPGDRPPHPDDVPWLDTSQHRRIIIGPGVIEPPGLMFNADPQLDREGPLVALGSYGMKDGVAYLLGRPRIIDERTKR